MQKGAREVGAKLMGPEDCELRISDSDSYCVLFSFWNKKLCKLFIIL